MPCACQLGIEGVPCRTSAFALIDMNTFLPMTYPARRVEHSEAVALLWITQNFGLRGAWRNSEEQRFSPSSKEASVRDLFATCPIRKRNYLHVVNLRHSSEAHAASLWSTVVPYLPTDWLGSLLQRPQHSAMPMHMFGTCGSMR